MLSWSLRPRSPHRELSFQLALLPCLGSDGEAESYRAEVRDFRETGKISRKRLTKLTQLLMQYDVDLVSFRRDLRGSVPVS